MVVPTYRSCGDHAVFGMAHPKSENKQILVLFVLGTEDDCQILSCTQDTRGMMLTEDDDVEVGTASCSQTRCTSMSYCEFCVTILISYC